MQNRFYRVPNASTVDLEPLVEELKQYFFMQGHQVQSFPVPAGYVLQAQKESTLSTLTGQSSALTIRFTRETEGLRVDVGNTKWLDKAAVGLVGYVILPPLILLPIVGAINQYRLSEDVWEKVEAYINRLGAASYAPPYASQPSAQQPPPYYAASTYYPPPTSAVGPSCPSCQAVVSPGSAFCSRCGSKIESVVDAVPNSSPTCPQCGLMNQSGARFCSGCGHRF